MHDFMQHKPATKVGNGRVIGAKCAPKRGEAMGNTSCGLKPVTYYHSKLLPREIARLLPPFTGV
jgi:hypothetical protein